MRKSAGHTRIPIARMGFLDATWVDRREKTGRIGGSFTTSSDRMVPSTETRLPKHFVQDYNQPEVVPIDRQYHNRQFSGSRGLPSELDDFAYVYDVNKFWPN